MSIYHFEQIHIKLEREGLGMRLQHTCIPLVSTPPYIEEMLPIV